MLKQRIIFKEKFAAAAWCQNFCENFVDRCCLCIDKKINFFKTKRKFEFQTFNVFKCSFHILKHIVDTSRKSPKYVFIKLCFWKLIKSFWSKTLFTAMKITSKKFKTNIFLGTKTVNKIVPYFDFLTITGMLNSNRHFFRKIL